MISVAPILDDDLAAATLFMREHLNPAIEHAVWMAAFSQNWMSDKPNNGFMLLDDGRIVGVLGALYSTQAVDGKPRRFCNLTSLVLLQDYRGRALDLLARCLGQPGFDFTNLTPNPAVDRICRMLKFRPIAQGEYVFPLVPMPRRGVTVRGAGGKDFVSILSRQDAELHDDHAAFPWLHAFAFRRGDESGIAFYTRSTVSGRLRMPAARFLHISNPGLFLDVMGAIAVHLMLDKKIVAGRIEQRLLPSPPAFSARREETQPRLYRGQPLADAAISNLYTERVALPIS